MRWAGNRTGRLVYVARYDGNWPKGVKVVFFSIVIPTYNRKPILEKCLRAMEAQMLRDGGPVEGY